LPHKRLFVNWVLKPRGPKKLGAIRMEQDYGPDGIRLVLAMLPGFVGGVVALLGLGVMFAAYAAGQGILWFGLAIQLIGLIRAIQASVAGRRFRGGRPFSPTGFPPDTDTN
jgi:hypothetical protein